MKSIALINTPFGNTASVSNAIRAATSCRLDIIDKSEQLAHDYVVFPGNGTFSKAMAFVESRGFLQLLKNYLYDPSLGYVGICVGMQICSLKGWETAETVGLGYIQGLTKSLISPRVGWDHVSIPSTINHVSQEADFFFMHSYAVNITESSASKTIDIVHSDNNLLTQFHPERSGKAGINLLRSYLN